MRVTELMRKEPESVAPDATIREVVEILESSASSSVPVVGADNRLIGIISERDVIAGAIPEYVKLLHCSSFLPDLGLLRSGLARIADDSVQRYMTEAVVSVEADADDLQAANLMLRNKLRLLPVIDTAGRLVGVIRRVDLFKACCRIA